RNCSACTHSRRTQFALLKGLARGSYLRTVLAWTIVTSSAKCSVIHRTTNRQRIQFIINSQLLRLHAQPSDTICTAERPRKGLLSAHSTRVDDLPSSAKCSVIHRTTNRQRIQFTINSQLLRLHAQ